MKDGRLEVTDIMVDDYVDVRSNAAPNTPHIERITPAHFLRDEIWLPIPITKEILEKNGFELYEQDFTSNKVYKFGCSDYIEACDDHQNSEYNYFNIGPRVEYRRYGFTSEYISPIIRIKYVHELQHAMHLCRIDKKIEL